MIDIRGSQIVLTVAVSLIGLATIFAFAGASAAITTSMTAMFFVGLGVFAACKGEEERRGNRT